MVVPLRGVRTSVDVVAVDSAVDSATTDGVPMCCGVPVSASRTVDFGLLSGHVRLSSWLEN